MKNSNLTNDDKRAINHMIRNAINDHKPGLWFWLMFASIFLHTCNGK